MRQEELKCDQIMIKISEAFREEWLALRSQMDDHPEKVDWQHVESTVLKKLDTLQKDLMNVETRL